MPSAAEFVRMVPTGLWVAAGIVVAGVVLGFVVGTVLRRLLERAGVPELIEGTSLERTARDFGTSTVVFVSKLFRYFIIGLSVLAALAVAEVDYADPFWNSIASFLPQLFVAILIVLVGIVVADKVELFVAERLRGLKLPQVGVVPIGAKYSVVLIAVLIALSQVGVATGTLQIVLGGYLVAVIVLTAVAFKNVLASGAAGAYLLLHQPYGIGDEVRVGDTRGIVSEMDLFVTHIEADDEEMIVPNSRVFEKGIVRVR